MMFNVSNNFKKKKNLKKNSKKNLKKKMKKKAENHLRRQHQGNRYWDHRANMTMSAAVRTIEYQKQLTDSQAESFVSVLDKNINWLTAAFETQVKVQRTLSSKLSNAISSEKNQLQTFKIKGRKQAMTG